MPLPAREMWPGNGTRAKPPADGRLWFDKWTCGGGRLSDLPSTATLRIADSWAPIPFNRRQSDNVKPSLPGTIDLHVQIGRLQLPSPRVVASGTFGYAREMASLVNLSRL